ncbi:MAG: CBS domain-containing protein [Nitrososphaeria archaeon]|nr:CBS domain-containing protein [Nitrososphaeria archaeon]NDB51928.1 CBS domain-containing protein [Nitrosopumilaceae archaeon]NDB88607.1 CBS domain-containing protein [Nitrososphaerota archaeon]NDB47150.1 CBS domain-containing protein [Nitrososphaeria archaeon]NDB90664.1 CBS domain-containing protein [Nitrososphaerota archaeon]
MSALDVQILNFIDMKLSILESNQTVAESVKKMEEYGVDSLLIRDDGHIRGIVTYRDVLFDVVSKGKDPSKTTLKEIMKTPLLSIEKNARVRDAITMMTKNNVRRLIVLDNTVPIGVISQKTLVGNITQHTIPLPELEMPSLIRCPYCSSVSSDKTALSTHIDNFHIGKGLFEGNMSRANDLGSSNPPNDFPKTIYY